jgi:ubiquinone/menaquinone biosynthesis C-methylase UbiE
MGAQQSTNKSQLSPAESTKKFYNDHVEDYIANINQAGVTHAPIEHANSFVQLIEEFFPVMNSDGDKKNTSGSGDNSTNRSNAQQYKVLELGCGYGRDAELFAKTKKINIIATDYARSMLVKAQERLEAQDSSACASANSIHFMELDMRDIGKHFLPDSMHGIWACATVIHLPKRDVPALLKDIYTVLKPGGVVYVSVKVQQDTEGTGTGTGSDETFDPDMRYGGIRKLYAYYQVEEFLSYFRDQNFILVDSGIGDHRKNDGYATHPFVHVFARKPSIAI